MTIRARCIASVLVVFAWCVASPDARQVTSPQSLTDVDHEVIDAVLRDNSAQWFDRELSPGAAIELVNQTITMCGTANSLFGCIDWNALNDDRVWGQAPDRTELRAAFAKRNRLAWRVGSMTIEPALNTASAQALPSISTSFRANRLDALPSLGGGMLIHVSAPAFSADGQEALLYIWSGDRYPDGMGGSGKGTLILVDNKTGQWLQEAVTSLSIETVGGIID